MLLVDHLFVIRISLLLLPTVSWLKARIKFSQAVENNDFSTILYSFLQIFVFFCFTTQFLVFHISNLFALMTEK
jgi:hypothetical protein